MSTFKRKESVALGARRLVCSHLEESIHALSQKGSAQGVRRPLMRAQAIMALVAPQFPAATVRRDRKLLEEVQRALDDACFPGQASACLQKLSPKTTSDTQSLTQCIKATRKRLTAQSGSSLSLNTRGKRLDPMVYRLVANLAQLRGHVGSWPDTAAPKPNEENNAALPQGLIQSYRAAQRALDLPHDQADTFTKAASALNVLRDQLAAIGKCCPVMLKAQRSLIGEAATAASSAQFALSLQERLAADGEAKPLIQPLSVLVQKDIAAAQKALNTARHQALAETPAAFNRRLNTYWAHWRQG